MAMGIAHYYLNIEKKPPLTFPIPAPDALPVPYPWNMSSPPFNDPSKAPLELNASQEEVAAAAVTVGIIILTIIGGITGAFS